MGSVVKTIICFIPKWLVENSLSLKVHTKSVVNIYFPENFS